MTWERGYFEEGEERGWEGIEGQKKGGKERGTRGGKQVDRKGGKIMEGRAVKEEGEMFHLIL